MSALIIPTSPIHVTEYGEDWLKWLKGKKWTDRIMMMSGSVANYASQNIGALLFSKTSYTGETTIYHGLWSSALTSSFNGATSGESAYTSYARLSTTNNSTIFGAGSGTTSWTITFPSDATKSWATSTGTGTNNTITYLGGLNGNAGTSSDKAIYWCSVTSTTINSGDTPQLAVAAVSVVFGS